MNKVDNLIQELVIVAILLVVSIGSIGHASAFNNEIEVSYQFKVPEITIKDGYAHLSIGDCFSYGAPGMPVLPIKVARILLPYKTEITNITIIPRNKTALPGTYKVYPGQRPYPLSYKGKMDFTEPDPEVYGSSRAYPGEFYTYYSVQSKKGYQILILNLQPIEYIPQSGILSYFDDFTVKLSLEQSDKPPPFKGSPDDIEVDNRDVINTYPEGAQPLEIVFNTGEGTYPSIMGVHKGYFTPTHDINVHQIYTYPCAGTGGHSEYVAFYENGNEIGAASWDGYQGDYHNIRFDDYLTLQEGVVYSYELRTGSYPQIIHNQTLTDDYGIINCTSFVDANGRSYNNWIPAIRLEGYFVDGEGVHNIDTGKNFSTIQAAIEDSDTQDGHTIEVDAGTYVENVNVSKQLTLQGIGMPTVDANGSGSAITVSTDGCMVEGFNVTGASTDSKSDYYAGIKVTSGGNSLSNNTATNNNYGIFLLRSSNNTLTNNIANSNYWYGIYLAGYPSGSSNNILAGNIANGNNYYGIGLKYSNNNTIEENKVSSNNYEGIYVLSNSCNNNINSNTLSNNSVGIAISRGKGNNIRGNTVFLNSKGIIISSRHNNITENTVYSNEYGIDIRRENNNVTRNSISSNSVRGIGISRAYNNVTENNVSSNNLVGISIGILTRYFSS